MTEYPDCRFCGNRKKWHGPECMDEWLAWAAGQVEHNQHVVYAAVGLPGAGKSGLNLCLAIDLQAPKKFELRKQLYFRPKDRIHVARRLGKGMVVLGDESSGEGGHKRRAMSTPNVDNVMDLDTMRQRNQVTVFTSPEFEHLDPAIQEACMWVFSCDHAGNLIAYEVQHSGKPDNRFHVLKERFRTPGFPHAATYYPELWREYLEFKDEYLAGKDDKSQHAAIQFEEKSVHAMQSLLKLAPIKVASKKRATKKAVRKKPTR